MKHSKASLAILLAAITPAMLHAQNPICSPGHDCHGKGAQSTDNSSWSQAISNDSNAQHQKQQQKQSQKQTNAQTLSGTNKSSNTLQGGSQTLTGGSNTATNTAAGGAGGTAAASNAGQNVAVNVSSGQENGIGYSGFISIPPVVPPTPPSELAQSGVVQRVLACGPLVTVAEKPIELTHFGMFHKGTVTQGHEDRVIPVFDNGVRKMYTDIPFNDARGEGFERWGSQVILSTSVVGLSSGSNLAVGGFSGPQSGQVGGGQTASIQQQITTVQVVDCELGEYVKRIPPPPPVVVHDPPPPAPVVPIIPDVPEMKYSTPPPHTPIRHRAHKKAPVCQPVGDSISHF